MARRLPALPAAPFFINFRCICCVCFFEVSNRYFLQKVLKSDSKREPKGGQKPPKWRMSDLSKHMVFTIRITLLAISAGLREHMFSTMLFGHCFFKLFRDFLDFRCQKGLQNGRLFWGENASKIDLVTKKLQRGPKGGPGAAT